MSLILYEDKYSAADNSLHRDKSDYHTPSDTIIYNLHL